VSELAVRAAADDAGARGALLEAVRPLVQGLARRLAGRVPAEELEQAGFVGVLVATRGFDPGQGTPFIAYAKGFVVGEMLACVRQAAAPVHVPRSVHDARREVDSAIDALTAANGRPPTVAEIADASSLDEEQVVEGLHARMLRDTVPVDEVEERALATPDAEIDAVVRRVTVAGLLDGLDERSKAVVSLRFGGGLPQREIADRLGISQMQVSRILRTALERLADRAGES
jgi:RNA polymerase sigma-B factor